MFANTLKTTALLALMLVLFILIGDAVAGEQGMIMAFIFGALMNFVSYWFSDKIVLAMYRAKPVTPEEAPQLYAIVERLSAEAGIPVPRVYIIDSPQPNAFATGRSPRHAAVAVTTGILKLLTPEELEGVLAHEIAHIKNWDILTSTLAATFAAAITMIARIAFWFGPARDDEDHNPLVALAMLILAPLAAILIQMAISRTREFAADRDGALISGKPRALANALIKIEQYVRGIPVEANPATAHMFIVNPLSGVRSAFSRLFSTHPPTEERVRRLLELEDERVLRA